MHQHLQLTVLEHAKITYILSSLFKKLWHIAAGADYNYFNCMKPLLGKPFKQPLKTNVWTTSTESWYCSGVLFFCGVLSVNSFVGTKSMLIFWILRIMRMKWILVHYINNKAQNASTFGDSQEKGSPLVLRSYNVSAAFTPLLNWINSALKFKNIPSYN